MKKIGLLILGIILLIALSYAFTTPDGQLRPVGDTADSENAEAMSGDVAEEEVVYHNDTLGHVYAPSEGGPYPGVILIHEWWGVNDDIKQIAHRYAENGYVAFVVDLYDGTSTTNRETAGMLAGAVRENTEEAFANLEDAIRYLESREDVDQEKLASVGWCFGGGWAYQMAANDLGVAASVMYYGQFDPEADFEHMRASIIGHFGEEDMGIAVDDVREFQAALETANGTHEVYIYPNVGHGFANYRGGDNLAYSEEAAELAWQRTHDFLGRVLGF